MKYTCSACGYVYDEAAGIPNAGISSGNRWEWLPGNWACPRCRAPKSKFKRQQSAPNPARKADISRSSNDENVANVAIDDVDFREHLHLMSFGELSALCSGLAESCNRQYLTHDAEQFSILANYYYARVQLPTDASTDRLLLLMEDDLSGGYTRADTAAEATNDRGAKRILKWGRHVTRKADRIVKQYKDGGNGFPVNTNIYVCEICGYIHIGETPPDDCHACGAPGYRFSKVE